jgi:MFS family permease
MEKRALFTLYFTIIAAILGLSIISPLMPTIATDLKATGVWMGIIFSGFAISRAVVMPVMGGLSDKYGRKIFIAPGLLLLAVIALLYPLATNVYTFTGVRLLNGLAAGMVMPVVMAYAGDIVHKGKEAESMSITMMMFYLGTAVGTILGGFLWHLFGEASVFYVMSGVSVIALLLVLPLLPEIKNPAASKTEERESFKSIIKHDAVKLLLVIGFISAFRQGVLMSFLPSHATGFHINVTQMGIIIAAGILFTAILLPCFGTVADKLSRYKELLLMITGSFIGTIIFIVPLCNDFITLLLVNVVVGIGTAMSMAVILDAAVVIGKKVGMGFWMGIVNTIISLGTLIAPLMSGVVMDYSGINSVFYFAGIVSLLFTFIGCYYVWRWSKVNKQ